MKDDTKILLVGMYCFFFIGICPVWIGFIFNIQDKVACVLMLISMPTITLPLCYYVADKIIDKILNK
jgi:hypothetical protein